MRRRIFGRTLILVREVLGFYFGQSHYFSSFKLRLMRGKVLSGSSLKQKLCLKKKAAQFSVFSFVITLFCILIWVVFIEPEEIGKTVLRVGEDNRLGQRISEDYGNLPLRFEQNSGQTDARVKFLARGKGYTLFLTAREAVLKLQKPGQSAVLRMELAGANRSPQIVGQNELAGKSNYFVGDDPNRWKTDVPNFSGVRYKEVYPGIDQVFYGNGRQLEYDFVVAPETDYRQIAIDFSGAENLEINPSGELVLTVGGEKIVQKKPFVYQEIGNERREIAANYSIQNPESKNQNPKVGFEIGEYDRSKPLTIDPVLVYSTYLGGNDADGGRAIAVDDGGNVYVTGNASSSNFPTVNPYQANVAGNGDVFVTKINAAGTAIIYSTYVGGSRGDSGRGIDFDNAGNAYVTGTTGGSISSNDFPTVNAFDNTYGGTDDAIVFKLNPAGNALLYSTYLGGSNSDIGHEIKVNRSTGEAFVAGNSLSQAGFPTTFGAFNTTCSNCVSGSFVTKFNAQGSALIYSTYIGPGPANDLAIDADGSAYITGSTTSTAFPITPGAAQPTCTGCNLGRSDAFVTKLNATGSALVYSTYLGGSISEVGSGIAVDGTGNAYVTGRTESGTGSSVVFPTTPGAFQTVSLGVPDGFVTKLNPTGTAFVYSTFLGGNVRDEAFGIAADPLGNVHVIGQTRSTNFPLANPFQTICPQNGDCVFISSLDAAGSAILFSTFFGQGEGLEVAADSAGNIYVTGVTYQGLANLPTMNPIQPAHGAGNSVFDGFVAKIQVHENQTRRPAFDFDGDGKADISIFRPSAGEWWMQRSSSGGIFALQFGSSSDRIVPADYTGDGKADVAVWRPASGEWFILRSEDLSFYAFPFGTDGDIPVPADYDGDGRADAAVFRPSNSTWHINKSSGGYLVQQFGISGDVPITADYDGDGKSDISIYRASAGEWWIQRSTAGLTAFQFGNSNDKPVQGDYTGDGKADAAFYRPTTGEWFVLRSEDQTYFSFPFGTDGDTPVPGDYDGDGKTDAAVFRPSNSTWFIQRTNAGILIQQFGSSGDRAIPSAFIP